MKIKYLDKPFNAEKLHMIEVCNQIIDEYWQQGLILTLRQLYYRVVATGQFPSTRLWVRTGPNKWVRDPNGTPNAEPNYNWLGELVSDARIAGLMHWDRIEDKTRALVRNSFWENPQQIMNGAANSYHQDLWRWQPYRVEVWIEKDALESIALAAAQPLDVPVFSCRGYTSQTAVWEAAQRMIRYRETRVEYTGKHQRKGGQKFRQKILIFHLGDHDPSGIDMTRDIQARLELFIGESIDLRRIALNMEQIQQYNPPPNPAKSTDSRFRSYLEQYGDESWELDALEPNVIVALIQANIRKVMDKQRFQEAVDEMEKGRSELKLLAAKYREAVEAVSEKEDGEE